MILLIIEDDALFAELVQLAINAPTVLVAGTMRQALAMMELQQPNFIVLDLSLPDSNPKHTLAMIPALKEKSGGARVTVVTGYAEPDIERQARANGADHFVAKDPGDELVRSLAASHTVEQPCASRDTVESIERKVAEMTGTPNPFPGLELPRTIAERAKKALRSVLKKG